MESDLHVFTSLLARNPASPPFGFEVWVVFEVQPVIKKPSEVPPGAHGDRFWQGFRRIAGTACSSARRGPDFLLDGLFCLGIEDMELVHVEHDRGAVTHVQLGARVHAGHERVLADEQV